MSYVLPLLKSSVNPAVQTVVQGMLEFPRVFSCSWEIVQQGEKWKPELSSVNSLVLIPVSRLTGSTRPTTVVLKLFCETCSLVTILAGVGDAILTIKTPRFSNQPTRLLSRDCFMKSTGRYHKSFSLRTVKMGQFLLSTRHFLQSLLACYWHTYTMFCQRSYHPCQLTSSMLVTYQNFCLSQKNNNNDNTTN